MICYIKTEDNINKWSKMNKDGFKIKKIDIINYYRMNIKKYLINQFDDKIIIYINKKIKKKKLKKILDKLPITNICLSKDLDNYILDKKYQKKILFKKKIILNNVEEGIGLICSKLNISNDNIYVILKRANKKNIKLIKYLVNNFKNVFCISNDIYLLNELSNYLYSKYGIIIIISNSLENSLRNAEFIINIDENNLDKFNIFRKANIVNIENYTKYNKKNFEGKIINDIDIDFTEQQIKYFKQLDIYDDFDKNILYESINIS